MASDDIYTQYGIKKEAPKNVKLLCLEVMRMQKLYNDLKQSLGTIRWWDDHNAEMKSREIWLRMNMIDQGMNEMRQYIFMAWQNREPHGIVEEIEERFFGKPAPTPAPYPKPPEFPAGQ